ncbi:MAG TPA: transglutaminase family protein [Bryobacteraceae bacterium]|jgi:transglutaminase-like putative cysteine protease|nr:transglutaminase family protein [Bryobacteraceae bacterium]
MSLLTVRHVTIYRYSEPVELGEHRMMFRPRESHDLRLLGSSLEITPRPTRLRWLHDAFDNSVAVATFDGPTAELRFDSSITLEHFENTLPEYPLEEYAKTYPFRYSDEELANLARAFVNQHPSDSLSGWVSQFLDPSGVTGTMSLLRSMTLGIRQDFQYSRRMEKGVQSPTETLRNRGGCCRDFAVLMIEAMRSLGLAARFVSGYIFVPGVDSGVTNGAGATHAWVQAYLPGAGWIDFDPTNSIIGNRNLIRVAVAWDQKQALPLWGTYTGATSSFLGMDVAVSVRQDGL